MGKKIIQVCFSLKGNPDKGVLRSKLIKLSNALSQEYGEGNYIVKSCHLSEAICIDAGFSTAVPEMFKDIFGDSYSCELTESTLTEAMANMSQHRSNLSKEADKLVVICYTDMSNVALEVLQFTGGSVIIL
jgi:hypothetical protein